VLCDARRAECFLQVCLIAVICVRPVLWIVRRSVVSLIRAKQHAGQGEYRFGVVSRMLFAKHCLRRTHFAMSYLFGIFAGNGVFSPDSWQVEGENHLIWAVGSNFWQFP